MKRRLLTIVLGVAALGAVLVQAQATRSVESQFKAAQHKEEVVRLDAGTVPRHNTIRFTPDSRNLVFIGQIARDTAMWRVPVEGGGKPEKVNVGGRDIDYWRFNPQNNQVAFSTRARARDELWKMENFLPKD